ncbi:MAG: DUF2335 domain-containing protein [Rhodospirillaceae bacterium]|nr:DUF2335 domain-containing protein [Rhodospirillaceae bacterium]
MAEKNEDQVPIVSSFNEPQDGNEASQASNELQTQDIISVLQNAGKNPSSSNLTKAIFSLTMMSSGPLPPPTMLAEYERAIPGLGQKIVGWTEQQREHRQSPERLRIDGSERRMNRGQIIAASVALFGLALAASVGMWGISSVGITIAIVSVGGPTAAVALARYSGRATAKPTDEKSSSGSKQK